MSELQRRIADGRHVIAAGGRPVYHATWLRRLDCGAIDVGVSELPIVHLFVPDELGVMPGARVLIARTLDVDASSFDVRPAS